MNFQKILDKYRKISFSERDKGARFERLIQAYLYTDPAYATLFDKVWLWDEFPGKNDLGGTDTGIDLVARTKGDEYWAIQCKCYQENAVMDKPAIDSFLATSSKTFKDIGGKKAHFAHRLWVSTTNKWGPNATQAIKNQNPEVTRINLFDLMEAPVDWLKLEKGIHGELARTPKKSLRPHQKEALEAAHEYYKATDRGKLIMACGTGKTFTSLRISEYETDNKGLILFLVPSISLLGQTLREWSANANEPINAVAICSDPAVSKQKKKNEDIDTFSTVDLAYPASTDPKSILKQFEQIKETGNGGLTVVFSTYQSIDVIAKAQKELLKKGFPEFDLIVCDEAHRTTGVSLAGEDESAFTKVHDGKYIKAKKRLYMTATPRLYDDNTKSKAAEAEAILCSMDDPKLYGDEIYRIGFGEAVERDLLTDYKVLILTLNSEDIPKPILNMIEDNNHEINTDDASKLIGCINALSKQFLGDEGETKTTDPRPMKRAVAFCSSIAASEKITETYNTVGDVYLDELPVEKKEQMVSIESKHMDGSMSAPTRDEILSWLKEETPGNECRVVTNVKVLSEGVDVPTLDSVMFLSARNSQVDVVQSVGRVMRKAKAKKYGYIIIPVIVPSDIEPELALNDNERYKVVWTVLNALRAHDDRFNATVNKIELNKKKPKNIVVGRPDVSFKPNGEPVEVKEKPADYEKSSSRGAQLYLQFEELQSAVYARMVQKVGDRRYWEQWAKSVAEIAQRHTERITKLIRENTKHQKAFERFIKGLHKNINPSISEADAIEMLSQHIITKPVFDALFEGYSFVKNNPMSQSMQNMIDLLEGQSLEKDADSLEKFYDSVKQRAKDIDNADAKQRIIIELYDKFFKTAFPKMVDRLGIVYTPIEVVDFIIHSVNDILIKEFGRSVSDENVHILDPFTGTGTFITRLLQSGLIKERDLDRKYKKELHANELVLLAYYIAAINIENAYHDQTPDPDDGIGKGKYVPFDGICLTDTFQLGETKEGEKLFSEMFPQNSKRVERQMKAPLKIIMGNPPYSIGQKSANDNAQNQSYPKLDQRISETYAKLSNAGLNKSLYDAYIKAFRWSTDRLDKNGGIVCFVSNGAWLDGNSTDGFRKSLEKEFSSIYVFNLRGNQRTSGELSRKEGGKIFGSGSRTPISITLLVKHPNEEGEKARVYYKDIGNYLTRDEKLLIIKENNSFYNTKLNLRQLKPNQFGDWVNLRKESFNSFIPLAPDKKNRLKKESVFIFNGPGIATGRDSWVYNYDSVMLGKHINAFVSFYNEQNKLFKQVDKNKFNLEDFIDPNPKKISWTRGLRNLLAKGIPLRFIKNEIILASYRPFNKQYYYGEKNLTESPGLSRRFFPTTGARNLVIALSSTGTNKGLSVMISDCMVDYHYVGDTQFFPLYIYEEESQRSLFTHNNENVYGRKDAISDFIFNMAKKHYGIAISKEDLFYYVYGFLHSRKYREEFENDLKKQLPRIPIVDDVKDFWAFSRAGRRLAELHLNYEEVPFYDKAIVTGEESKFFTVEKMHFPKKVQKDTIIYNSKITITNIPEKAYDFVVNGKSAIEWIMERYQVTIHKESGIINDPNDWGREHGKPRYILDLLLSVINVSVQTVSIVDLLPKVSFE